MRVLLGLLIFGCVAAYANAQCGCSPSMAENQATHLPLPDKETGLYEGDMRLTSKNFFELLGQRNLVSNTWPNRVLYYKVSSGDSAAIKRALDDLTAKVGNCIKFELWNGQSSAYVDVFAGSGCWSYVGRTGRRQQLSLQRNGCYSTSTIQHEFIHALGFYHEQSRSDRDSHINILWGNINNQQCHNFYKQGRLLHSNWPAYDTRSVMHYFSTAFSCNGQRTIQDRSGNAVGGSGITNLDIQKLKRHYGC